MKKILFVLAVLFSASFCFAREYDDDSGFIMNFGGTNFYRNSFNVFNPNNNGFYDTSFNMEFGNFKSAEDGLIDFVSCNVGGMNFGAINTKDRYYFYTDNDDYLMASNDANVFKLYDKETVGLQINIFCFSVGWMGGLKIGLEGINMNLCNVSSNATDYYDGRIFMDLCTTSYVSFNMGGLLKLFLQSNIDYSLMDCRFIYTDKSDRYQTAQWSFFRGDYPVTISFGICFI